MDFQDFLTPLQIRKFHRDTPVKTSRTEQRRIQGIRTVGCRQDHNTFGAVKSIHLGQKLVQCLLTLIVAADVAVTLLSNGINLINKYDTGCFFISLLKQITYFGSTHTNEHLHKFRS